jgi:hypothetical protein
VERIMPMQQAPSLELAEMLKKALAALASEDLAAADEQMAAAAQLCHRLQAAGLGIPHGEVSALRDLAEKCGLALADANQRVNDASIRDENLRRGIRSYHATLLQDLR